ncbi:hypothetical protein BXP70_25945 [Hymenobacter crusticola]|uniref:Uncharacterized protein n=2 Tax=Hymenobacter crusticola TaxID=1770526 RepID=A0A243W6F6_9BACT|nr:hypothetical protein BXP70_25945 [Hymenobacter crusticola]
MLHTLRLHLLSLRATTPYYRARLLRIAEQLAWVVRSWPAARWPAAQQVAPPRLLRQAQPLVPAQHQVLAPLQQLTACLHEGDQSRWAYYRQQQLLDIVLYLR